MTARERMVAGELYDALDPELVEARERARLLLARYNATGDREALTALFGRLADDTGAIFIVRSTSLDYRAPARLDDTLTITSRPGRIGRASVEFTQEAWCGDTLLVAGHIRLGCVDRHGIRPAAIPPVVLDALQRGPVIDAGQTGLSTKRA